MVIPATGSTQSGGTALLDAAAPTSVTSVTFELTGGTLNDQVVAKASPTIYGWMGQWNTTTVPNGTYTLQSVASYGGGVTGVSAPVTLSVNNPPPTTTVIIPATGSTQSGGTALLDAAAPTSVTSVTFELTGGTLNDQVVAKASPTIYGWVGQWNTTTVPNGTYTLQSVASYGGGVTGVSRARDAKREQPASHDHRDHPRNRVDAIRSSCRPRCLRLRQRNLRQLSDHWRHAQ